MIWLRDRGEIALPVAVRGSRLELSGELLDFTKEYPTARPFPGLRVRLNGRVLGEVHPAQPGPFAWPFPLPPGGVPAHAVLSLELLGVAGSNFLAWMGRLSRPIPLARRWRDRLQEYRLQKRNRQLRIETIAVDGEAIIRFRQQHLAPAPRLLAQSWKPGLNLAGFFRAALGVGESVRCACSSISVRSSSASAWSIPSKPTMPMLQRPPAAKAPSSSST